MSRCSGQTVSLTRNPSVNFPTDFQDLVDSDWWSLILILIVDRKSAGIKEVINIAAERASRLKAGSYKEIELLALAINRKLRFCGYVAIEDVQNSLADEESVKWIYQVELLRTGIAVCRIIVMLLTSVEVQQLIAEYGINGFRSVIQNLMLDLNGSRSLATEKTGMLPAWPKWIDQPHHKP
ncbi:hypothetical protein TNCV_1351051 [Trichonephila clavipes]|nr:hypothetical protein TNCV_1351051 [Trichonephila clavipes]